jgi:hypothetical protein
MSGKKMLVCTGWIALMVLGTTPLFAGEEGGGDRRGGGPGRGGRGGMMMGGRGGTQQWMDRMFNRGMGVERTAEVDDLPFGESRRLVRDVPVGGVDSFRDGRDGWEVEDIFALTPEQEEAVKTLREEYKTELAKLQAEYDEAQKKMAEKVKALRLAYETKANDVMTDPAKAEKLKLDALAKEFAVVNQEQAKGRTDQMTELRAGLEKTMAEAREKNDWQGVREAFGKVHGVMRESYEQRSNLSKEYRAKMTESVTGDAKTKLEELLKEQDKNRWGGWGGRGRDGQRPGGGGGEKKDGGGGQKPPAPPGEF